ncbi:hypothetical protein [Nannocystis pusilla]|uniref:Lipoprotein n=1 Tax=Nannocystis pusilla TaxID=889268 RepID=A0ABS7TPR6_9BACT|nr:hypothetical protein [Nannocystis pusilla]MBZ5710056.1 hypothetical protein [Nannocystis pusilla]
MASVIRRLCIAALIVGAGGCHHEDDSAELRYLTSSSPEGDGEEEPEGSGEEDPGDSGDEHPGKGGGTKDGGGESVCGYHTHTQGGWSSTCSGGNPGCERDEYFDDVCPYPDYLVIGCGSNTATFTSSEAVRKALPAGGDARPLKKEEMKIFHGVNDPPLGTVLAGQALALSLNVRFSAVHEFVSQDRAPFPSLVIADEDSPCRGMSVQDVLDEVNHTLGGCDSSLTPEEANVCATRINESFVGGEPHCSTWYRESPDPRLPLAVAPSRDVRAVK